MTVCLFGIVGVAAGAGLRVADVVFVGLLALGVEFAGRVANIHWCLAVFLGGIVGVAANAGVGIEVVAGVVGVDALTLRIIGAERVARELTQTRVVVGA